MADNPQTVISRTFTLVIMMFLGFAFLASLPETSSAQELDQEDLSEVRSEDISDDELRRYIRRAEAEGISESEAMSMARERGMPQSEIDDLRRRIDDLDMEELDDADEDEAEIEEDEEEPEEPEAPDVDDEDRDIFGYSLFAEREISFEPTVTIPTPKNYQLGAGDELIIDIWGETENTYQLEVNNEGNIAIENLGPVYVNGLTIEEANDKILDKLKQLYSGLREGGDQNTWALVSLGRVRSIQVTLMGEVNTPGTYTISSLSNVFNALYHSGGPDPNGSFRKIEVIRDNEVVSELDMYDFLIHGDQSDNIRLRDQDVIKVNTYKERVEISGEVNRTGRFEMVEGETLDQLVKYAGDFTDEAYTARVKVHRNTPTQRSIITVEKDGFEDFELQSGDRVEVDEILDIYENRVQIDGAVWRPGEFELREDMTLYDLIEDADGVRPDAFRTRGVIYRLQDDFTTEVIPFNVGLLLEGQDDYDIELEKGDEVLIQSRFDMQEEYNVTLRGAVQEPGDYNHRDNMTLEDLILEANGFREAASEAKIEVARRIDGEPAPETRGSDMADIYTFEVNRDLSMDEEAEDFTLEPYDHIYVRRRPDYQEQVNVSVEGELMYPGDYSLEKRGERVSDIIERAGGLTDEAYLQGATLIRSTDPGARSDLDLDFADVDDQTVEVDDAEDEMHVGIDLKAIMEDPGSADDLYLREGDVLSIPEEPQTVRISGAVMRDTEVRYREGFTYRDYINQAGGYAENARQRRGYVIYANGEVDRRRSFLYITSSPEIQPGSEIIVPEAPERERLSTSEIVSISSAVVSMATSIVIAIDRVYR